MLSLTLVLGVWQLQRLQWKTSLLAEIDRGEATSPVPLTSDPPAFRRVVAQGRYLPLVARYGAEVRTGPMGAVMGAQLVSPLARDGADPVLVDRGWLPLDSDPAPPTGPVRLEGYIRPAEHRSIVGIPDDPVARRFYTLDPAAIGASLGLRAVAPYTLVVLGPPGTLPEPAQTMPRPPNDHLSYALTWFGLAAALVVVFVVYVRAARRKGPPR